MLVNDFNKKENINNLDGPFGSWNIFYSDPNQHCKDEFSASERLGSSGYSLKLDYDVDCCYPIALPFTRALLRAFRFLIRLEDFFYFTAWFKF